MFNNISREKMQTEATARLHYIPAIMVKIKNIDSTTCWRGFIAGGNVKLDSHSGKQFGNLFKKNKNKKQTCSYHRTEPLYSWAFIPEK